MSLYDRYGTNKELEENGVWVEFGDGVQLLLARIKSQRSLSAKKAAEKPYREVLRNASRMGKEVTEDIQTRIALNWLVNGVVLDWKEVTDRTGKKLKFSPDNARDLFEDLPDFLDDVVFAASSQATYQEAADREAVGNSVATSGGS
jgi:hypothetical protein